MKEIKILLVDDDELYRRTIKLALRMLSRHDLQSEIFEADNLQTALEILHSEVIDLIVTDGMFPKRPGGYLGSGHGDCSIEDFRGNDVATEAKRLGIKVIGISTEPKYFCGVDAIFKKNLYLGDLINKIVELMK